MTKQTSSKGRTKTITNGTKSTKKTSGAQTETSDTITSTADPPSTTDTFTIDRTIIQTPGIETPTPSTTSTLPIEEALRLAIRTFDEMLDSECCDDVADTATLSLAETHLICAPVEELAFAMAQFPSRIVPYIAATLAPLQRPIHPAHIYATGRELVFQFNCVIEVLDAQLDNLTRTTTEAHIRQTVADVIANALSYIRKAEPYRRVDFLTCYSASIEAYTGPPPRYAYNEEQQIEVWENEGGAIRRQRLSLPVMKG